MNVREVMETLSKDQLVDLVIDHSDNGWFPLELFLLKADYDFTADDLEKMWNHIYEKANELENQKIDMGAGLLCDAAEACFEYAKKFEDESERNKICQMLFDDLGRACVDDGIGMYGDSEWIYMEVRDQIAEYLGLPSDDI